MLVSLGTLLGPWINYAVMRLVIDKIGKETLTGKMDWLRKYNYLLGVGLDCGTQLTQTVIMFAINLANAAMPAWWGNNVSFLRWEKFSLDQSMDTHAVF